MRHWASMLVVVAAAAVALLAAGRAQAAIATPPHRVFGPDGETADVFSYADAIRERVFIPVPGVDQDADGLPDTKSIDIIRPAETNQGMKVPRSSTRGYGSSTRRATSLCTASTCSR